MKLTEWILICFLLIFGLLQTGCASFNHKLKGWLGGNDTPAQTEEVKQTSTVTKFSDNPDEPPRVRRQSFVAVRHRYDQPLPRRGHGTAMRLDMRPRYAVRWEGLRREHVGAAPGARPRLVTRGGHTNHPPVGGRGGRGRL